MPPDLALLSTLIGSNYPCLELIFMVPEVFEPLKFDCTFNLISLATAHRQRSHDVNFGIIRHCITIIDTLELVLDIIILFL